MNVRINGYIVQVDPEDLHIVEKHNWSTRIPTINCIYFQCATLGLKKDLHRLILPGHKSVDHKNGDTLDCRKQNLRGATKSQQSANTKKKGLFTSSQYKGVSFYKRDQKWEANIMVNRKKIHLGRFLNEIDAANAYDAAAMQYQGDYAKLNF